MKKHNGSMLAYLNSKTQEAAQYSVQRIDAEKIIPNEKNFYSIDGIEELANSFAVSDHLPPLEVVDNGDGTYRLISGERRLSATLYRIERGEIEKASLLCHVLPAFESQGNLTAEQMETLSIIFANNYRKKTALDELREVEEMEPIARAIYEEAKARGELEENGRNMKFRTFFAEEILNISPTELQRLKAIASLSEAGKQAFEEGKIGKSVASELASLSAEDQASFLEALESGEVQGTIAEIKNRKRSKEVLPAFHESLAEEEPSCSAEEEDGAVEETMPVPSEEPEEFFEEDSSADEVPLEAEERKESNRKDEERTETNPLQPMADTINDIKDYEDDANLWVIELLEAQITQIEASINAAKASGDTRKAHIWELRKAAVQLVIDAVK